MKQADIKEDSATPEIEWLKELERRQYVVSVVVANNAITVVYDNGFKTATELPITDLDAFQDLILKHVNIKLLEQKAEASADVHKYIEKVKPKDGKDGATGKQGERGEQGDQGNGIQDAEIDLTGHLIIKTDEGEIDAGEVNVKRFFGGGGAVTYSNEAKMPEDVGGLPKGTRFDNVDFRVFITKLLYGYDLPSFSLFTLHGIPTELEIGGKLDAGNYSTEFVIDNPELLREESIQIKQDDIVLLENLTNTSPVEVEITEVQSNKLSLVGFEISAFDTTGVSFNAYHSLEFKYKIYHGEYGAEIDDNNFDNPLQVLLNTRLLTDLSGEQFKFKAFGEGLQTGAFNWICYPSRIVIGFEENPQDPEKPIPIYIDALKNNKYTVFDVATDVAIVMNDVKKVDLINEHGLTIEYNCYRTFYELHEEITMGVK